MCLKVAFAVESHDVYFQNLARLINECLERKLEVFCFEFNDIHKKNGRICAPFSRVKDFANVKKIKKLHETFGKISIRKAVHLEPIGSRKLEEIDVIFLKKGVPLDWKKMEMLCGLPKRVLLVNNPNGILRYRNKKSLAEFRHLIVPTRFSSDVERLVGAIEKLGDCVVKSIEGYGGHGVYHVFRKGNSYWMESHAKPRRVRLRTFLEHLTENGREEVLVTKFLKNVAKGDKRLLVLNGRLIGSILRKPEHKGGWICNISLGGTVFKTRATQEEMRIIRVVARKLLKHGIYFMGIDTLEDDNGKRILSEINVVNVGAIYPIEELYGCNLARRIVDFAVDMSTNKRSSI